MKSVHRIARIRLTGETRAHNEVMNITLPGYYSAEHLNVLLPVIDFLVMQNKWIDAEILNDYGRNTTTVPDNNAILRKQTGPRVGKAI